MKKAILILAAILFVIANYSCNQKIDYEKEKKAVIAAAEEETAAYYACDFDRWAATYLQDSTLLITGASKYGPSYASGWETLSSYIKGAIVSKKDPQKEVKTPVRIKVYDGSAWIVFDNEVFNTKGESIGKSTVIQFLEKHEGKWKIVYRSVISDDSYYQPDLYLLTSISYAKSLGKKVDDMAGLMGEVFKTAWSGGYNDFVNGMLYNWGVVVPKRDLNITEQDSNHIVFNVNKVYTGLKTAPQFNVTYDDYLMSYNIACQRIADFMGAIYKQETTPEGVKITITKK